MERRTVVTFVVLSCTLLISYSSAAFLGQNSNNDQNSVRTGNNRNGGGVAYGSPQPAIPALYSAPKSHQQELQVDSQSSDNEVDQQQPQSSTDRDRDGSTTTELYFDDREEGTSEDYQFTTGTTQSPEFSSSSPATTIPQSTSKYTSQGGYSGGGYSNNNKDSSSSSSQNSDISGGYSRVQYSSPALRRPLDQQQIETQPYPQHTQIPAQGYQIQSENRNQIPNAFYGPPSQPGPNQIPQDKPDQQQQSSYNSNNNNNAPTFQQPQYLPPVSPPQQQQQRPGNGLQNQESRYLPPRNEISSPERQYLPPRGESSSGIPQQQQQQGQVQQFVQQQPQYTGGSYQQPAEQYQQPQQFSQNYQQQQQQLQQQQQPSGFPSQTSTPSNQLTGNGNNNNYYGVPPQVPAPIIEKQVLQYLPPEQNRQQAFSAPSNSYQQPQYQAQNQQPTNSLVEAGRSNSNGNNDISNNNVNINSDEYEIEGQHDDSIVDAELLARVQRIIEEHERQQKEIQEKVRLANEKGEASFYAQNGNSQEQQNNNNNNYPRNNGFGFGYQSGEQFNNNNNYKGPSSEDNRIGNEFQRSLELHSSSVEQQQPNSQQYGPPNYRSQFDSSEEQQQQQQQQQQRPYQQDVYQDVRNSIQRQEERYGPPRQENSSSDSESNESSSSSNGSGSNESRARPKPKGSSHIEYQKAILQDSFVETQPAFPSNSGQQQQQQQTNYAPQQNSFGAGPQVQLTSAAHQIGTSTPNNNNPTGLQSAQPFQNSFNPQQQQQSENSNDYFRSNDQQTRGESGGGSNALYSTPSSSSSPSASSPPSSSSFPNELPSPSYGNPSPNLISSHQHSEHSHPHSSSSSPNQVTNSHSNSNPSFSSAPSSSFYGPPSNGESRDGLSSASPPSFPFSPSPYQSQIQSQSQLQSQSQSQPISSNYLSNDNLNVNGNSDSNSNSGGFVSNEAGRGDERNLISSHFNQQQQPQQPSPQLLSHVYGSPTGSSLTTSPQNFYPTSFTSDGNSRTIVVHEVPYSRNSGVSNRALITPSDFLSPTAPSSSSAHSSGEIDGQSQNQNQNQLQTRYGFSSPAATPQVSYGGPNPSDNEINFPYATQQQQQNNPSYSQPQSQPQYQQQQQQQQQTPQQYEAPSNFPNAFPNVEYRVQPQSESSPQYEILAQGPTGSSNSDSNSNGNQNQILTSGSPAPRPVYGIPLAPALGLNDEGHISAVPSAPSSSSEGDDDTTVVNSAPQGSFGQRGDSVSSSHSQENKNQAYLGNNNNNNNNGGSFYPVFLSQSQPQNQQQQEQPIQQQQQQQQFIPQSNGNYLPPQGNFPANDINQFDNVNQNEIPSTVYGGPTQNENQQQQYPQQQQQQQQQEQQQSQPTAPSWNSQGDLVSSDVSALSTFNRLPSAGIQSSSELSNEAGAGAGAELSRLYGLPNQASPSSHTPIINTNTIYNGPQGAAVIPSVVSNGISLPSNDYFYPRRDRKSVRIRKRVSKRFSSPVRSPLITSFSVESAETSTTSVSTTPTKAKE